MTMQCKHSSYAPKHHPIDRPDDYRPAGEFLMLADGGCWDFENPEYSQWSYRGLALALSRLPRFNGNTSVPYTVAEHCIFCHDQVPDGASDDVRFFALVHDLAEAAFGDRVEPLKRYEERKIKDRFDILSRCVTSQRERTGVRYARDDALDYLKRPERALLNQIRHRSGRSMYDFEAEQLVKEIDQRALLTEMRDLNIPMAWALKMPEGLVPYDTPILPMQNGLEIYKTYLDRLSRYVDLEKNR